MMLDMFGIEIKEPDMPLDGKRKRKPTQPKGHAARPGSGPAGEKCKTCEHYTIVHYQAGKYRKCGAAQGKWTHGPGSDIRANDLACEKWVASK